MFMDEYLHDPNAFLISVANVSPVAATSFSPRAENGANGVPNNGHDQRYAVKILLSVMFID